MNRIFLKVSVILIALFLFQTALSAQGNDQTEKRELINQFRKLTGADKVNLSLNFSVDDVRESLAKIVNDDTELTTEQKRDLQKAVTEAFTPIEKAANAFFADKDEISKLSEKVIYNIYDRSFTEGELRELTTFYRTPTGQKAAAFLPTLSNRFQTEVVAIIVESLQTLIKPVSEAETKKLKQKIEEVKKGN